MSEKFKQDNKTGKFIASGVPVMAEKPIAVRLPIDVDLAIRDMPDRTAFLREVISEAVRTRLNNSSSESA